MKKVTVYMGPSCAFCDAAKRLLVRNNISFQEINISLGLVGLTDINEVNDEVISKKYFKNMKY